MVDGVEGVAVGKEESASAEEDDALSLSGAPADTPIGMFSKGRSNNPLISIAISSSAAGASFDAPSSLPTSASSTTLFRPALVPNRGFGGRRRRRAGRRAIW